MQFHVSRCQGHRFKVIYMNRATKLHALCPTLLPYYSFMLVVHARRTCIWATTPVVSVIMLVANNLRDYLLYGHLRAHNSAVNTDKIKLKLQPVGFYRDGLFTPGVS